jgi:hypothetical protein
MNHAAFTAVHGIELERNARALYFFRGGHCAQTEFLDAQQAVIVGVEGKARMVFRRHAQHFHGGVFEREQQLRPVTKEQIDVAAGELHDHIRRFEIVFRRASVGDLVVQLKTSILEGDP